MHVHVTFYVKSKCIHLVKKTIDRLTFTFFPVFFFFTVLKFISKQLSNFLWVWNWFFHVNYLRLLKKLNSYKKNKETTYHLLIHDSPSEMTKTKTKQSNSTITITTDWIKHSKYKDWYHFTDLDASICRNDSLVIVLACLYLLHMYIHNQVKYKLITVFLPFLM